MDDDRVQWLLWRAPRRAARAGPPGGGGLLRAQGDAAVAALRSRLARRRRRRRRRRRLAHAALGLVFRALLVAHPAADLHNQHVLFPPAAADAAAHAYAVADGAALDASTGARRPEGVRASAAVELAYPRRDKPAVFKGKVEADEEGTGLFVYTERRRVRIPLHDLLCRASTDSSTASPRRRRGEAGDGGGGVQAGGGGREIDVELFGVLKAGAPSSGCASPPSPTRRRAGAGLTSISSQGGGGAASSARRPGWARHAAAAAAAAGRGQRRRRRRRRRDRAATTRSMRRCAQWASAAARWRSWRSCSGGTQLLAMAPDDLWTGAARPMRR